MRRSATVSGGRGAVSGSQGVGVEYHPLTLDAQGGHGFGGESAVHGLDAPGDGDGCGRVEGRQEVDEGCGIHEQSPFREFLIRESQTILTVLSIVLPAIHCDKCNIAEMKRR